MEMYDVAVIGGGIVGCAILQKLAGSGYNCVLLEKSPNLVTGASSGNSGIRHSGYDTESTSLEGQCIQLAKPLADTFYNVTAVPQLKCGAIMVAWTQAELNKLPEYMENSRAAGQDDVRMLSSQEIGQLEPGLSASVMGGLYIPGEAVIDPWLTAITLAHAARRQGAQIHCSNKLESGQQCDDGTWKLTTSTGVYMARIVVNAAGLHGDHVENIAHQSQFTIYPSKGDFAVFGKEARQHVNHIILPVPNDRTKGIIIFPTVYGNVIVGPTAEDVNERDLATPRPDTVKRLVAWAHKTVPKLKSVAVIGSYCGLRPATQHKDFQIYANSTRKWITVGGIRSTGATACMGIASYVHSLIRDQVNLEPSITGGPAANAFGITPQATSQGSEGTVIMDGIEYKVTHPITVFGQQHPTARL